VLAETLRGGARRFQADQASFVVTRVRPGVLLVQAEGPDRGQFRDVVLAELSAELERFAVDVELFVDAHRVDMVAVEARGIWTAWLERHRDRVRRVHMLTATPHVQLVASIAGHYSRTKLITYQDAAAFGEALAGARGAFPAPPSADMPERANVRRDQRSGGVELDDGECRYDIRWATWRALLLVVSGEDRGTLASAVFDEIRAGRRPGERFDLFIDLRAATMPPPRVSSLWTEWFSAHRDNLQSVWILSTRRAVSVTADIAGWRSRTGGLVRVVEDPAVFAEAIARLAPQLSP
jgi:hypothetical protein